MKLKFSSQLRIRSYNGAKYTKKETMFPVDDQVPGERVMAYDPNNSCMKAGTVYPNMKEFRLAMRQFAINAEFELKLVKTDPERYIGGCKVEGCPWHIVGHKQPNQKTVMAFNFSDFCLILA